MKKNYLVLAVLVLEVAAILGGCGEGGSQAADPLAGTAWVADNDGSWWNFDEEGGFGWYQNKQDLTDNYYAGNYEAHRGQAGLEFLAADLAEFGYTRESAEELIELGSKMDSDYSVENFICFACDNKSFMMNGEEQLEGDWRTAYLGFIWEDDTALTIINLRTGTWYGFTKE